MLILLVAAALSSAAQQLPSIELPQPLDRVLRDYERAWQAHAPDALTALFAEDGFVLSNTKPPVRSGGAWAPRIRGNSFSRCDGGRMGGG
jgi:hypothetical protein